MASVVFSKIRPCAYGKPFVVCGGIPWESRKNPIFRHKSHHHADICRYLCEEFNHFLVILNAIFYEKEKLFDFCFCSYRILLCDDIMRW